MLLFFCVFVIRYNLRPLRQLGLSAEKMAEGDFNVSIPDSKRRDEIGQLQHSFFRMQRSLNDYINKIRHSTEALQERNAELERATEMAKEDDRMKSAVISNMTDKMLNPVNVIADENSLIRQEYMNLSEEEMAEHVDRMLEQTEIVTSLLNELLDAADATGKAGAHHEADESSTPLSNEDPATI